MLLYLNLDLNLASSKLFKDSNIVKTDMAKSTPLYKKLFFEIKKKKPQIIKEIDCNKVLNSVKKEVVWDILNEYSIFPFSVSNTYSLLYEFKIPNLKITTYPWRSKLSCHNPISLTVTNFRTYNSETIETTWNKKFPEVNFKNSFKLNHSNLNFE